MNGNILDQRENIPIGQLTLDAAEVTVTTVTAAAEVTAVRGSV